MTNLIHKEIRALLQAAADKALLPEEQTVLDTHLAECNSCRAYAQSLTELQDGLSRVMQQHWNIRSRPLPIETIKNRLKGIAAQNQTMGALGKFAVIPILAFALFMTMALKVMDPQQISSPNLLSRTPGISLQVPRPPVGMAATRLLTQGCNKATYIVQAGDTLDLIAARYGIPKESIVAYNGLGSDKIDRHLVLILPLCEHTSIGTTITPMITITIAPLNNPINPSPRG